MSTPGAGSGRNYWIPAFAGMTKQTRSRILQRHAGFQNRVGKSCLAVLILVACQAAMTTVVFGSDWNVRPYVTVEERYDSNVLFRATDKLDDYITSLRPRVEARYLTERFTSSLDLGADGQKFIKHSEFDTVWQDYKAALSYAITPVLRIQGSGYFRADTTLQTELQEQGLLTARKDRRRYGGEASLTYSATERFSVGAGWTRGYTEYTDQSSDLLGYMADVVNTNAQYEYSPRLSFIVNLSLTRTSYDDQKTSLYETTGRVISNYTLVPSLQFKLSEASYFAAGAGYRITRSEYTVNPYPPYEQLIRAGDVTQDSEGFIFQVQYHRNWERGGIDALVSRDQYSSLEGNSVERNRFSLSGNYRYTERWSSSASASYWMNDTDQNASNGEDQDYFVVGSSLRYLVAQDVYLAGSGEYSRYFEDQGQDPDRFRVFLSLNMEWPRTFSGK